MLARPTTDPASASAYRPDIDGLRAIAVLLVLVFHFDLLAIGHAGFVGVDIFFVISGYLISGIIWRDLEAGKFSLSHFYARRIRRLAPALIAVQLLLLGAAAVVLLPREVESLAKESLAAQTYVSNIYYWRTLNYFGLHANSAYLLHTWSLGIEEQFYLLYPLLLIALRRWARRWFGAALMATLVLSFALNLALIGSKPEAVFYLLPTRAWELAAGAILALVQPRFEGSERARTVAGLAGVVLLALTLVLYTPEIRFPGSFALLPVLSGCLLLMAGTGGGSPVSRMLALAPATFIGRISYPLYLVHWPLNVFGTTVLPAFPPVLRWGAFLLSIALAWGITRWIEQPIRFGDRFRGDRQVVRLYLAGLAAVLLLIGSGWATQGWRFRFSDQVLRVADVAGEVDPQYVRWDFTPARPFAAYLRPIGKAGPAPGWLIYGDSHAAALTGAFSIWLEKTGATGEIAFASGCLPLLDTGSPTCREFNRQAVVHAAGREVMLVSTWYEAIEAGYLGRDGKMLTGAAARADFEAAVIRTITALRQSGARVYAWEPLPSARHSVPEAMARSMVLGPHWPIARSLAQHRAELGFVATALDRAGVPRADRIDPAPALCPGGTCSFTRNGLPLYSDNGHPALNAQPWFAGVIAGRR